MADPYAALLEYAWYPQTSDRTVDTCVSHYAFDASVTQLIFPEAMSGYHECRVLDALRAAGRIPGVRHVVFQDMWYKHPYLKEDLGPGTPTTADVEAWRATWKACVERHGMTLTECCTYVELYDHCASTNLSSGVIYINGAWNTGNTLVSRVCDPQQHKQGARSFWRWCAVHAKNKPVNVLRGYVGLRCTNTDTMTEWNEWSEF